MKINPQADKSNTLVPSMILVPRSFRLAKKTYEQIAILFFVPSLISTLGYLYLKNVNYSQLAHFHLTSSELIGLILLIVWIILSIINFAPSIYLRVESSKDREPPTLKECYSLGFKKAGKIIISEIAATIIIGIGLLVLIIPGILAFRRFALSAYYACDNPNLTIIDILKKSASETKQYSMSVYGTFAIVFVYSLLLDFIFGGFSIGSIIILILSYIVLFMPSLRYTEIASLNLKNTSKSKRSKKP